MSTQKQAVTVAVCWASGLIGFTRPGLIPTGAIAIASGPSKELRRIVEAVARHGYGKSAGKLLVPGAPEANDQMEAIEAALEFRHQVKKRLERKTVAKSERRAA